MISDSYYQTPQEEIYRRINKLQLSLQENNISAALIIQKADLFYFSGTGQNAHLFIPDEGVPILFVKKSFCRAERESPLKNIKPLQSLKEMYEFLVPNCREGKKIGMELDILPTNLYLRYQKLLNPAKIVDMSKIIREIRMIKSSYEIKRLKEAAKLNYTMFSRVRDFLKEGISELELAGHLESVYRQNGHQGAVRMRGFNQEIFYGHLMSGWNLAYPSFFDGPTGGTGTNPSYPQSAGYKKINRNEPVMVDYVGVYNGYMVDQARIFAIGCLSDKFLKAYDVALTIKKTLTKKALPGVNAKELFELAHGIASETVFKDYFLGHNEQISFIGHGLGIELDELPVIARNYDMVLQPGMVFAMEPKFIFPDGAVGIEDTFVITEQSCEQITMFDELIQFL